MTCKFCFRESDRPDLQCKGTRDMEEREDRICFDALMRLGGGEYSLLQDEAIRRDVAWGRHKQRQL